MGTGRPGKVMLTYHPGPGPLDVLGSLRDGLYCGHLHGSRGMLSHWTGLQSDGSAGAVTQAELGESCPEVSLSGQELSGEGYWGTQVGGRLRRTVASTVQGAPSGGEPQF